MAWDVTKLKFSRSKTLDGPFETLLGMSFGSSGSKMYCVDMSHGVREYDLGINYDPFTETYVQRIDLAPDDIRNPIDVEFNPTGDVMYVLSISESSVHEYRLGTPWDISTAVHSGYESINTYSPIPQGWKFKSDGTMLYVTSGFSVLTIGYSVSTPWDISTLQKIQEIDLSSTCTIGGMWGIDFKPDGSKMFINCWANHRIIEYGLTTAWNIETAKYIRSSGCTVVESGTRFSSGGTVVHVISGDVYEYTLPVGKHRAVKSS